MSARFARNAFTAASRRAQAHGFTAAGASRRAMSSTSHAAHTPKKDTPWLVGSLLLFGPAFLYLVSPSARKNPNLKPIHDDKHDFPGLKAHETKHEEPAPTKTIMTDDEGTPADVTASIKTAADSDVPKASVSSEENAEDKKAAAESSTDSTESSDAGVSPEDAPKSDVAPKEGTLQKEGETEGSTDQGPARDASTKGQDPKEAAEKTPQEDKVKKGNEA